MGELKKITTQESGYFCIATVTRLS